MKFAVSVLAVSAAGVIALASAAIAQPSGRGPAGFGLLQHDANGDGRLTRSEFDTAQKSRFDAIDANRDGGVTLAEVQAERQAQRQSIRTQMIASRFEALDTDRNGQLSQTEFSVRPAEQDRGGRHGRRHHAGGREGAAKAMMSRIDANADGTVSMAEFSARGAKAFAMADGNKDGVVTVRELQSLRPNRP